MESEAVREDLKPEAREIAHVEPGRLTRSRTVTEQSRWLAMQLRPDRVHL
jgi:hypothetical protein